ncbi:MULTISPECIES: transglycosylase domain-containing protein [Pseudoalteromonas]|uniref:transglycosylase domain-containing protein n=1 Tax=Pseudoalteromonas TaxID=53246 RepID=UPI000C58B53A|nr:MULTISPECIES: transglycosylase domain-containing protein [Pseudoalteromonas]MAE01291.1 hypothetical protein [Pseudoalteromonas sp.]QMW15445.1 transglycosylase domain-containing protein [Pseudoalteromonas sp. MT33b]
MAKKTFLRILYLTLSMPFALLSVLFYILNICKTRDCYNLCIEKAKNRERNFDPRLIQCLYLGEDKRNLIHYGVDFFGVGRAILSTLQGSIQGASTIEQQFIRTVTGRYERTATRKIVEQLLALLVSFKLKKKVIAESYLSIAFFGTSMNGYSELCNQLDPKRYDLNFYARVIARLKYPQPTTINADWNKKFEKRTEWILIKYNAINKKKTNKYERNELSI